MGDDGDKDFIRKVVDPVSPDIPPFTFARILSHGIRLKRICKAVGRIYRDSETFSLVSTSAVTVTVALLFVPAKECNLGFLAGCVTMSPPGCLSFVL